MIRLEKALQLANLTNLLTLVKGYVDRQLSALASSLQDILGDVDTAIDCKGNCEILVFGNVTIATSAWASDSTYAAYPYRAEAVCSGMTADHSADVTFNLSDATSGNYAPVCQTVLGKVYLWAASKPETAITIQIEARKAVNQ